MAKLQLYVQQGTFPTSAKLFIIIIQETKKPIPYENEFNINFQDWD